MCTKPIGHEFERERKRGREREREVGKSDKDTRMQNTGDLFA